MSVRGVLDSIDDDPAFGRDGTDGGGNRGDVHAHAADGRAVNDRGNAGIGRDDGAVGLGGDGAGFVVMLNGDVFLAGDTGPAPRRRTAGRMLQRRAHDLAAFRRGHDRPPRSGAPAARCRSRPR